MHFCSMLAKMSAGIFFTNALGENDRGFVPDFQPKGSRFFQRNGYDFAAARKIVLVSLLGK